MRPTYPCPPGTFSATPFVDACNNGPCQHYGDPDDNIVSLYGTYGNTEVSGAAAAHFTQGVNLASQIVPLCKDGSTLPCLPLASPAAIVFLFIGFSNCDIEVCGGNSDIWDKRDTNQTHLAGQPCATQCPNLNSPDPNHPTAWNQVTGGGYDGVLQESFLYQVYHDPNNRLVGDDVVIFDGALGQQTLDRWDPTPFGHYAQFNDCNFNTTDETDPECNYVRVRDALNRNGYTEFQVQAIFLKSSTAFPQCDLKGLHCQNTQPPPLPDAYLTEKYMGNILRYLKCCTLDADGNSTGQPRYPNLKQVFVTSRIYGGYANGTLHGCLMPEPFAYEEAFGVQRLIVAQINGTADQYSGQVDFNPNGSGHAPWVDWGPYLWASGETPRSDGLTWCNGQNDFACQQEFDFRYGDPNPQYQSQFWGDFTHPTASAAKKVAGQLVTFIGKTQGKPGSPFVTPWIGR